jgi:hypothetical protein
MDTENVASPHTLPAGTWFLFSEHGVSKLAFSAVYEVAHKSQTQHCIVVSPGIPTTRPMRAAPSYGAFPIEAARVEIPSNVTAFRSGYDGEYEPGSLIVLPKRRLLAFAFSEGRIGLVDLESGRLAEEELRPPFGWFTEWRLFQKRPNKFEEIFRFPDRSEPCP